VFRGFCVSGFSFPTSTRLDRLPFADQLSTLVAPDTFLVPLRPLLYSTSRPRSWLLLLFNRFWLFTSSNNFLGDFQYLPPVTPHLSLLLPPLCICFLMHTTSSQSLPRILLVRFALSVLSHPAPLSPSFSQSTTHSPENSSHPPPVTSFHLCLIGFQHENVFLLI